MTNIRQKQKDYKTNTPPAVVVILCFLGASLLCQLLGCVRKTEDPFASKRRPVIERLSERRNQSVESQEVVQTQTDLVLNANGRVERLSLAANSRRILLERRLGIDETQPDYPNAFLTKKALVEEERGGIGVELWNIEFSDARLESFCPDYIGLLAPTLGCAAFDEKGERIFWTYNNEQKGLNLPALQANESTILRGSAPSESETLDLQKTRETSWAQDGNNPLSNAVLTRLLEYRSFKQDEKTSFTGSDNETKRLKSADETKKADCVRLSPNARWLICRSGDNEDDLSAATSNERESEWSLVLLRDRNRVVTFPSNIKMTFDNSTSDEEIKGRIVDVLAVSDEGDLVATLVEEQFPTTKQELSFESTVPDVPSVLHAASSALTNAPRYKIVIWDLNVARTVDLEKAKKPLSAIEVSQMSVPAPIPRKFCKFSPTGERFAARVEPRYITIWQSANGRLSMELGEHDDVVQDFAFAPHSAKMVVGVGGKKARLSLWEIRKGVVLRTLDDSIDHATSIDAVSFAFDERHVYFANDLGEVRRWDVRAH